MPRTDDNRKNLLSGREEGKNKLRLNRIFALVLSGGLPNSFQILMDLAYNHFGWI